MKTLFFGKQFINQLVSNNETCQAKSTLVYLGSVMPSYGNFIAGGPHGFFKLDIFSGEVVDNPDDSNKLISFEIPSFSTDPTKSGFLFKYGASGLILTLGMCNAGAIAGKNGKASWFRYYCTRSDTEIIGSIGTSKSDCDLIVSDPLIISGELYKSFGFKLILESNVFIV